VSYPFGNFVVDAPLNADALSAGKSLLEILPACKPGDFDHVYYHWEAGCSPSAAYNINVDYDGQHFHLVLTTSPAYNAYSTFDNKNYAAHTWLRNTGGIGVSTDNMLGATTTNFGDYPETLGYLEHLCAAGAACALKYGIDLAAKTPASAGEYANEEPIMTHAVAAFTGGNPPPSGWYNYSCVSPSNPPTDAAPTCERSDLNTFVALPKGIPLTVEMALDCNIALLARTRLYKIAMM
jgi:hypothetical protein